MSLTKARNRMIAGSAANVIDFGAVGDGVTDDTAAIQAALSSGIERIFWNKGTYKITSSLAPQSNTAILGVKGSTIIKQHCSKLFDFPEDLKDVQISGLSFDYQNSDDSIYDVVFALKAHQGCTFSNFDFVRYDDQTICERMPTSSASINTIDNVYSDWEISACAHVSIDIGLDGYYYKHVGDGSTTVLNTSIVWPEQLNSSVVVVKETSSRLFNALTLTTDYTVSYDGSNNLTITLTTPATADERIHIWPSSTTTGGNRRPISNNLWKNIRALYVFKRGHQAVRWLDAETYSFERLILAADNAQGWVTNPYGDRSAEAGDYNAYEDCVCGYRESFVSTPSSLRGFYFGPGSHSMNGRGIRMDQLWLHSGTNGSVEYSSGRRVQLTGTVSGTSGSATVTGSGTAFEDELTLIGTVPDVVEIDDNLYAISSIDSDTQITLSTNLTTSPSGSDIYRISKGSDVDAFMDFASMGAGFYSTRSAQSGQVVINSLTERTGSAVISNGDTSVTVTHGLRRAPNVGELNVVPHSLLAGRSWSIANITSTTFDIIISSAAGADYTFGWRGKLMELV